ncbi:MAG TPA: M20/M25/M40 family metallo-hydrolase [Acidimicrobiales bacterium]|jgi:acetylornithine deacetylase/succinyl-diaminopimelate desuccinylase-like protein|nr:M20/M25/M40 family metallo-hydrolase [Acidimicrobiales bacterium]
MAFEISAAQRFVDDRWQRSILPTLHDYIRIPNKSPAYDPRWDEAGHMQRAVDLVTGWIEAHPIDGMRLDVHRLPGRTPLVVVDVPATGPDAGDGTVLLYGHLDKQPEMVGWRHGLGPWEPVLEGDRLYGRGGADDGYAAFASLSAIAAVREAGGSHARCVLLVEASEESGSPDLPAHVDALGDRLGEVELVICLDSGCATWDRMWTTTSLRGLVGLDVRVDIVREGIHSGASGVVPSSFRILRSLLSRIEDEATGDVLLPELQVEIPAERVEQAKVAAEVLGDEVWNRYPLVDGARLMVDNAVDALLGRTWKAAVSVTGVGGIPPLADAGNVLRPHTALTLSIRVPPRADDVAAREAVAAALTADPPYGVKVSIDRLESAPGWDAPPTSPWLADAIERASIDCFGNPAGAEGEGGTIPFMGMLGEKFPDAQFVVTGVLGPGTNAHGPNEFLHVPTARNLTAAVASILDSHARRGPV